MQFYKTTTILDDDEESESVSWQRTLADASKARSAAKAEGLKATTADTRVPTDATGLLAWLNENVKC